MKRLLLPIYAYSLFDDLVFIYSFYAVMFSDRGMSALQISVLFAVWSTVAFLLEVPSGALADKYSRKHILLFAQASKILGYVCWMLFPTFWGFLAGFVFWGVQSAFHSGTFEAFIFDELKHFGREQDYPKVIGRTASLATVGILIADVAAAVMIRYGYRFMLAASLVPLAASCMAVLWMRPAERAESTAEHKYFAILKQGVREAIYNRVVLRLIVFLSFALIFFGSLDEYWTLFYTHAGIPKAGIGILSAIASAAAVIGGLVAYRFKHFPDRAILAVYLVCGLSVLVAAYFMRPLSVACVPLICFAGAVTDVTLETKLQQAITGDARATVLSVRGFLDEVLSVHIFIGFGAVACRWGYRGGFMTCAGVMLLMGALWLVFGGKSPFGTKAALEECAEHTL